MLTDLNWLTELVSKLPPAEPAPVTLFDMLGVSTREITISRVLAYYLEENEAHGLNRLFLDSLLDCMHQKTENFPSPYTVERERHNIDILIRGESNTWAIILENKIYHSRNNPFDEYLSRVDVLCKQGVLVTLWPTNENTPKDYVNVTHKDWLECVHSSVVPNEQWLDNERQRLLYRDFMANMNTLTNSLSNDSRHNEAIRLFQVHKAVLKINNLLREQRELERYIQDHIKAVFAEHGFHEKGKQFYYPDEEKAEDGSVSRSVPQLRFYIRDEILTEDKLSIWFQLYDKSTSMGSDIRESIAKLQSLPDGLKFDDYGAKEAVYYHLAHTIDEGVMITTDFPAKLNEIIGRFFMKGNPLVDHCIKVWYEKV